MAFLAAPPGLEYRGRADRAWLRVRGRGAAHDAAIPPGQECTDRYRAGGRASTSSSRSSSRKKAPRPLQSPLGPASIRLVDGEEALLAWEELWTGSASDPAVHAALAAAGLGTHRVAHHFVAEVDGSLVGCGAAVVARATVAVEHIVTAATHRRRGIGAQLTGAALAIGRDRGAVTAILTASPDGADLYRRLGFVDREPVRRFVAQGR